MNEAIGGKFQIKVGLTQDQHSRIRVAADKAGMPMSTWMRVRCLEVLREEELAGFKVGKERKKGEEYVSHDWDEMLRRQDRTNALLEKLVRQIERENDMSWLKAITAGLQVAAWAVQEVEVISAKESTGEQKKEAASKLVVGGLGIARAKGAIEDDDFSNTVLLAGDFVQLAFEALDLLGVVNKEKGGRE
jgi:hypothetical protein